MGDAVAELIKDFGKHGWRSTPDPMTRTMAIVESSPDEVVRLCRETLVHIPKGGTFLDAALSFLPDQSWPDVISDALAALRSGRGNEAAESVIGYASLQCPQWLHPHLPEIFALRPNEDTYYEAWP